MFAIVLFLSAAELANRPTANRFLANRLIADPLAFRSLLARF
jgi:hypothetical protein